MGGQDCRVGELLQWSLPRTNYLQPRPIIALAKEFLRSSCRFCNMSKELCPGVWISHLGCMKVHIGCSRYKSAALKLQCLSKTQTTAASIGWKRVVQHLYNLISEKCIAEGVEINIDGPLRNIDGSEWFRFSREKYWEKN